MKNAKKMSTGTVVNMFFAPPPAKFWESQKHVSVTLID